MFHVPIAEEVQGQYPISFHKIFDLNEDSFTMQIGVRGFKYAQIRIVVCLSGCPVSSSHKERGCEDGKSW